MMFAAIVIFVFANVLLALLFWLQVVPTATPHVM